MTVFQSTLRRLRELSCFTKLCHSLQLIVKSCGWIIHIIAHPLLSPAFDHNKTLTSRLRRGSVFEGRQNGIALLSSNTLWLCPSAYDFTVFHVFQVKNRSHNITYFFFVTVQNITAALVRVYHLDLGFKLSWICNIGLTTLTSFPVRLCYMNVIIFVISTITIMSTVSSPMIEFNCCNSAKKTWRTVRKLQCAWQRHFGQGQRYWE